MRWSRAVIAAMLLLTLVGCQKKEVKETGDTTVNLTVLHKTPLQTFEVTRNGALLYNIRREIQHKVLNRQEVFLLRDHISGVESGMSEILFSAETFEPQSAQRYYEVDGALNEMRLTYDRHTVRVQNTTSLFGGETEDKMVDLPDSTFDELQVPILLRTIRWQEGMEKAWLVFRNKQNNVDTLRVTAKAPQKVNIKAGEFAALPLQFSMGNARGIAYLEQELPNRLLLATGQDGRRIEWMGK